MVNDRTIIDLIKENMMKEQIRNEEIITVLKEQIVYMKTEANYKNKLIESLLTELYELKKNSNNEHSFYNQEQYTPSEYSPTNTVSIMLSDKYTNHDNINESSLNTSHLARNEDATTSHIMNRKTTDNNAENNTQSNQLVQIDIAFNSDKPYVVPNEIKYDELRSSLTNAQKDDMNIYPKTIPGNSLYADITNSGRKVCILSDSMSKGIKMKELNKYINKGYVYRKTFDGATSSELAHYCVHTLMNDKPDCVIINIGTNDLNKLESYNIFGNIINIVDICKSYGVNEVYVSGIIFRENHKVKLSEINDFLCRRQSVNNYIYINNYRIGKDNLWNDGIHLNKSGTIILANNFIDVLNKKTIT